MNKALTFVCRASEAALQSAQSVGITSLAWHERQKSRLIATTENGSFISIVLERGETLNDGDLLQTEDGAHLLRICAKEEPLLKVFADHPHAMMRLIYHLANRHVKMMINPDCILIEPDPVLERLILGLGGHVQALHAAFEPERGAYVHSGHGAHHGHEESGSHSHSHSHSHGLDPQDYTHGAIGEELSRRAHGQN